MASVEEFVCKRPVKPVKDWLEGGEKDGNCPPCLIKPLAEMYLGTLEEHGVKDQAKELQKAWDTGDALTIAETMDNIKSAVGDTIKNHLVKLDCMAQSHKDQ